MANKKNNTEINEAKETDIQEFDIDAALLRLEEINNRLADKSLPLKASIKLYAEGTALADECRKHLKGVEKELQIITEGTGISENQ